MVWMSNYTQLKILNSPLNLALISARNKRATTPERARFGIPQHNPIRYIPPITLSVSVVTSHQRGGAQLTNWGWQNGHHFASYFRIFKFIFLYQNLAYLNQLKFHSKLFPVVHVTITMKNLLNCQCGLTHCGRDKMAAIFRTTFSNALSWMKMLECRLINHWNLFLSFELTIFQHWFR